MNIQVGKSAGIALLMAAALLAALFAMGVFAPAGVEAVKSVPAPTAELSNTDLSPATINAENPAETTDLTLTFELARAVESSTSSVAITLPTASGTPTGATGTVVTEASIDEDNITVQQNGNDVGGTITVAASVITIAAPTDVAKVPQANTMTTVVIKGLQTGSAAAQGPVQIQQGGATGDTAMSNQIGIYDRTAVPTAASAAIDDDTPSTLVIKYTLQTGTGATGDVVIDPTTKNYLVAADNLSVASSPDDVGGDLAGAPSGTAAARTITVTGHDASATITVTVASLSNLAAGDKIMLAQADSGYSTTLTVDGPTVSPSRGAPGTESGSAGLLTPSSGDDNASKAGAKVKVTITATAGVVINGGTNIVITLPGFGIPSSIDTDDVIIDGRRDTDPARPDPDNHYYGHPDSVSVSGDKITVRLPVRNGDQAQTLTSIRATDEYQVIFFEEAGITNPNTTGIKTITVKDADDTDEDSLKAKIVPSVSVKPTFVTSGGDATVTAKGVRDGTTTVYVVEKDDDGDPMMDDDGNYERGDALGTGTADDGVVDIEIDTSDLDPGATPVAGKDDMGVNTLVVVDAANSDVGSTTIGIKPTVKLGSETAKRSADLEISVSDWYYGDIEEVTIGGIKAEIVGDDDTIDPGSDMKATFKVTVPGNVRSGEQEVKVSGDDDDLKTTSATAMVTITAIPLDVSPSNVVPGHRVTITGSGFTGDTEVKEIMIGGKEVKVPADAESTSSGRVAVTVTVPLNVGHGDKAVTLEAGTRKGEGEITVPKPSITLDPAESVPGSVISVRGSGFAADGRVEVRFAGDIEEVGRADGSGDVHVRLTIPSDAGVGATNEVKVDTRNPLESTDADYVEINISDTADHKTPGPAITVPEQAQVGTLATISGTNFEPFTSITVMIGGKDATPSGAETDKNGAFEVEARVPRLSAGSHTITVEDGSTDENSVTETFTVVLTPVVSTPQEVFGSLGDNLVVVWRYDNATATWASYSPGAPAELNDLTGVSRGDIVWIQVTADVEFQGQTLYLGTTGWNLITLE